MPVKHSPGCTCCGVTSCCDTFVVKPLPTRTVDGSVVTYSDTEWNSQYVTGMTGTDNTVPANTTVTIEVPIGCTDYVVDVEVLDDNGSNVTSADGLRIKVGDCLQAECDFEYGHSYPTYTQQDVQWPTLISQHAVETAERDTVDGLGNVTRPFYGDFYAAYRFFEKFYSAAMSSGVFAFRAPDYRSDTSTAIMNGSVSTRRISHDAGGLTVKITIETGSQAVEIGLIRVNSGHISCSNFTSLTNVPTQEECVDSPLYVIEDPASVIVNNGASSISVSADGDVIGQGCGVFANYPLCTFDYDATLNISQWSGNYVWDVKYDNVDATVAQASALSSYLSKCKSHSWLHSDALVNWKRYKYVESEVDSSSYSLSHTMSITGTCNIVATSQSRVNTHLNGRKDNQVIPRYGMLTLVLGATNTYTGQTGCLTAVIPYLPEYCNNDSQLLYENLGLNGLNSNLSPQTLDPIANELHIASKFNLPSGYAWPNAKQSKTTERLYEFYQASSSNSATDVCLSAEQIDEGKTNSVSWTSTGWDVDVTHEADITKIADYSDTDPNYTFLGGRGELEPLAVRDQHLRNLSLYISDEDVTFEATDSSIMNYTAVNYSTNRPDYATCGCACTASELYLEDLYRLNLTYAFAPTDGCATNHRWLQFTDGTDTWYAKWQKVGSSSWTFLFRRDSDCKEIEFTGVSNAIPDTTNKVTKTKTNASGDTLSVDVFS